MNRNSVFLLCLPISNWKFHRAAFLERVCSPVEPLEQIQCWNLAYRTEGSVSSVSEQNWTSVFIIQLNPVFKTQIGSVWPKIRLRSQAKCRATNSQATNSQTNSQPQNTQLNLLTVTFLAILKVNRDKLALINRQWKCKKGKRLVITANFEEQNLGAVCNVGPRWENPDHWSARLANQIQRFRIPDCWEARKKSFPFQWLTVNPSKILV